MNTLRQDEVEGRYDLQVKGPRVSMMAVVHPEMFISDLKQRIEERTAIPCEMQRLFFQGKTLEDSDVCGTIGRDGRIELALCTLGGVGSPRPKDQPMVRPPLPDPPPDPWQTVANGLPDPWRKASDDLAKQNAEKENRLAGTDAMSLRSPPQRTRPHRGKRGAKNAKHFDLTSDLSDGATTEDQNENKENVTNKPSKRKAPLRGVSAVKKPQTELELKMQEVQNRHSNNLKLQQLEEVLAPSWSAGIQSSIADGTPMLPESQPAEDDDDMKVEESEHLPGEATPKMEPDQQSASATAMDVSPVGEAGAAGGAAPSVSMDASLEGTALGAPSLQEGDGADQDPGHPLLADSGTDISDIQKEKVSPAGKRGRQHVASPVKEQPRLSPTRALWPDPIDDNGCVRVDVQGVMQIPPTGPPTLLGQQLNVPPGGDLLQMLAAIKLGVDKGAAATLNNSASLDSFKKQK